MCRSVLRQLLNLLSSILTIPLLQFVFPSTFFIFISLYLYFTILGFIKVKEETVLILYQPMTHISVMSPHKPVIIYMGGLILLGVNTLYRLYCFFKLFPMVGKGLTVYGLSVATELTCTGMLSSICVEIAQYTACTHCICTAVDLAL